MERVFPSRLSFWMMSGKFLPLTDPEVIFQSPLLHLASMTVPLGASSAKAAKMNRLLGPS